MPAQPPFSIPTRTPTTGRSDCAMISLIRSAAASDSRITFGLGRGAEVAMSILLGDVAPFYARLRVIRLRAALRFPGGIPGRVLSRTALRSLRAADHLDRNASPHVQNRPGFVGHPRRIPRRFPHHGDRDGAYAWHA